METSAWFFSKTFFSRSRYCSWVKEKFSHCGKLIFSPNSILWSFNWFRCSQAHVSINQFFLKLYNNLSKFDSNEHFAIYCNYKFYPWNLFSSRLSMRSPYEQSPHTFLELYKIGSQLKVDLNKTERYHGQYFSLSAVVYLQYNTLTALSSIVVTKNTKLLPDCLLIRVLAILFSAATSKQ